MLLHLTHLRIGLRRRVQEALTRRNVRATLRNSEGAIDLASIMVGVLVIGIVAAVIAATVIAVVPWSQDNAAKQDLDAVKTAESVARVQDGRWETFGELVSKNRIQSSTSTTVDTDANGSCYLTLSASPTGNVYWASDSSPTPALYVKGTSASAPGWCTTQTTVGSLISGIAASDADAAVDILATHRLASAMYSVLALDDAGKLFAWGQNGNGELGTGATSTGVTTPTAIAPDMTFSTVATSPNYFSAAVDSSGHLWTWGRNSEGELGDGTTTERHAPVPITPEKTYLTVACGSWGMYAIDTSGHLWVWGWGVNGSLGDGDTTSHYQYVPKEITPEVTYAAVASATLGGAAIDTTGHLWTWGSGAFYGQLGNGATDNVFAPVPIAPDSTFKAIAGNGTTHYAAIDSSGGLWTWGSNFVGELGDGTTTKRTVPTAINTGTVYTAVAVGGGQTYAVDGSGHLWATGGNSNGELGDGTVTSRTTLSPVDTSRSYKEVANVGGAAIAISGSSFYSWGDNTYDQLGDGTTTSRLTPTAITVP